jgi:hypothetical protein
LGGYEKYWFQRPGVAAENLIYLVLGTPKVGDKPVKNKNKNYKVEYVIEDCKLAF